MFNKPENLFHLCNALVSQKQPILSSIDGDLSRSAQVLLCGILTVIDSLLQFTFTNLARLIINLRPALPTICLVLAWTITAIVIVNLVAMFKQGTARIRQMHRIPCANCRYSTNDYRLKCSVHPTEAFSENAINCLDFE